jgi:hypothetical protein
LIFPILAGLALACTRGLWRYATAAVVCLALAFNLAAIHWPWTRERVEWRAKLAAQQRFVRMLDERGIRLAFGSYWDVIPLEFDSRGKVLAFPAELANDFFTGGRVP